MSHPNPKLIDMDFTPPRDRRGPTPMPHPSSSGGSDEGVTGEIRSLMDQLQQTANEARHRLQAVQDERDSLAQEAEILQDQARDLRSRAAESNVLAQQISRLEQQKAELEERLSRTAREAAAAPGPGAAASGSTQDLQHRLSAAEHAQKEGRRAHEELVRQRDELSRGVDALNRTVLDLNTRYAAGQNQLVSLRQARDASQNQNRELTQKVELQEDLLAELNYRIEQLESGSAAVEAPAATPLAEGEEAATLPEPPESWVSERATLQRELAEAQRQEGLLREELATSANDVHEHAATELQLAHVEREAALAEVVVLRSQVERLRVQSSSEGGPSVEAMESLRRDREAAHVQAQMATREVMELRGQLQARLSDLTKHEETRLSLVRTAEQLQAQFAPLAAERDEAVRARDETLTSLASAQKQIDRVAKERDILRDTGTEKALELEAQAEEWRHRCEEMEAIVAKGRVATLALDEARAENRELSSRLDAQRLETIELATRLQAAQDQVRSLSATLAEARLQAKAAGVRPEIPAPRTGVTAAMLTETAAPATGPLSPVEAFPNAAANDVVRAMRRCYNNYARDPEDLSHLNELHCAAHSFAEAAREGQCVAVQRVGVALATLVQELYHFPEQITAEVLTSIVQTIEFLTALLKVKELRLLKDPANGTVCVIDDDAATRECLIMALETVMVNTVAYREPTEALCGLASAPVDLIVLDVQMPGMDGFELCSQIRQHSLHKHTPVIFVTGQTGPETREKCALCGGNDFLTKPFILAELGLKCLIMMVRTELHLA